MTVQEAMTREVVTVTETDSALSSLRALVERGVSGAPVVSPDSRLVGMVTEFDLLLAIDFVGEQVPVSRIMTREVLAVPPETTLEEARNLLLAHNWRRLPVVEDGRLVGVVARRDILKARFGL